MKELINTNAKPLFLPIILMLMLVLIVNFLGAGVAVKIQGITHTQICIQIFKNNIDFSNIIFFQNDRYFGNFFMFFLAEVINILLLIACSILGMVEGGNFGYILGLIFVGILSHFFAYFLIKKLLKEMKLISFDSIKKSVELFQNFLKNKQNSNPIEKQEFILIKNGQTAPRNFPFQGNQNRCQKRLRKIMTKKLPEEQKLLKVLRTFIGYLKIYAVFFNTLQAEKAEYTIKTNNQIEDLNNLKAILIHNFLVYL